MSHSGEQENCRKSSGEPGETMSDQLDDVQPPAQEQPDTDPSPAILQPTAGSVALPRPPAENKGMFAPPMAVFKSAHERDPSQTDEQVWRDFYSIPEEYEAFVDYSKLFEEALLAFQMEVQNVCNEEALKRQVVEGDLKPSNLDANPGQTTESHTPPPQLASDTKKADGDDWGEETRRGKAQSVHDPGRTLANIIADTRDNLLAQSEDTGKQGTRRTEEKVKLSREQLKDASFSTEPKVRNSIIMLTNLDSAFFYFLDNHHQKMVKWKYQRTMDLADSQQKELEFLLAIVKEVRIAISNGSEVADKKAQFVLKFLALSDCETIEELEETLEAHKAFRVCMRNVIDSSCPSEEETDLETSASGESSILDSGKSPDAHTSGDADTSTVNTLFANFKPFLGDSSVRPKERKPVAHGKSKKSKKKTKKTEKDSETAMSSPATSSPALSSPGGLARSKDRVRILERSKSQENLERSRREDCEAGGNTKTREVSSKPTTKAVNPFLDEANKSPCSSDKANYGSDLEAVFEEAENRDDDDYFQILKGIKHNFELAELLESVFPVQREPGNHSSKIASLLHIEYQKGLHGSTERQVAVSAVTSAALSPSTAETSITPCQSTPLPVSATTSGSITEVTWQSRVRAFLKSHAKPLAERLGAKPKSVKLTEEVCPGCRQQYRWPHLLSCMHRYCFPCIVKFYSPEKNTFTCPVCEFRTVPLDSQFSSRSLRIDVALARLMLEANLAPFCCTNCSSNQDAVKLCKNCLLYLCEECLLAHRNTESTSGHELENSDTKVGASSDGDMYPMCYIHPGSLLFTYCVTCSKAVCDACSQGDHNSHIVQSLDRISCYIKNRLISHTTSVAGANKHVQRVLINLKQANQELELAHRSGRRAINEIAQSLGEKVQSLRTQLTDEVKRISDMIGQHMARVDIERETYSQQLKTFREFVSRYVQGYPIEVLTMFPVIKNRFDYLQNKYDSIAALYRGSIYKVNFEPQYPQITNAINNLFSSVAVRYTSNLDTILEESPVVRDRHHVEPYKPLPYSLDYRYETEIARREKQQKHASATGAQAPEEQDERIQNFFRQTLPYSRAFGHYGRGNYEFAEPSGVLYLHDGCLAVCDTRNHRILIYNEDGTHQRTIGQPRKIPELPPVAEEGDQPFPRAAGKLYFPYRMAQCPVTKNIIVLERPPSLGIQVFTFSGQFLRCFGQSHLQSPRGITVDERGLILVLESKTMNFFIFTQEGELIERCILGALEFPNDVAAKDGTIYISDNRHHCVKTFDYSLNYRQSFGNESLTYYPISVGFNSDGYLVVADNHNTFNITIFGDDGMVKKAFKSRARHANCYNVALHPTRPELAVTTKEYRVLIFNYDFQPDGCEPAQ